MDSGPGKYTYTVLQKLCRLYGIGQFNRGKEELYNDLVSRGHIQGAPVDVTPKPEPTVTKPKIRKPRNEPKRVWVLIYKDTTRSISEVVGVYTSPVKANNAISGLSVRYGGAELYQISNPNRELE